MQAVFTSTGSNKAITVSGTVIAHGLTINSGATGYSFSGGSLTVTAGGIQANESVSFGSNVYIGGPQSWNVASGKTLTVTGPLHTLVSDLTFSGAGTTTISGAIDGGGLLNSQGAAPGGLIQAGSGPVYLTGTTNFSGNITAQSGAGTLYIAPPGAGSAIWNGAYSGGGTINFNCSALTLGGGASNFTGAFVFQKACSLTFVPAAGLTGTFGCVLNNSGPVTQNGPGTTIFNGTNTYSGSTTISSGVLQANIGTNIPTASFLSLNGGVLQSNGSSAVSFTRSLGTSGSKFQWTANGGGFSAGSAAMNVRVNNGTGTLAWGSTVGTNIIGTLMLSSPTATNVTTFQNGINLNGATRTIQVLDNPNSTADYAVISGSISGTSVGITKTGNGLLSLTGANTYTGTTTISGGRLQATIGTGIPTSSFLRLDGGVYQSNGSYTFSRSLGNSGSAFQWTANGGGFSAGTGALTVNVGSGAALTWGATVGSQLVGTLYLSSNSATSTTTFQNAINLNGAARTIVVDDNPNSSADYAILSGAISGATGSALTKNGAGNLYIQGSSGNTYSGLTTITGGKVYLNKTSGYAIPGNLTMSAPPDAPDAAGNNWASVPPTYVIAQGSSQIAPSCLLSFTGFNGDNYGHFELYGHSMTLAGISGDGLVENTETETGVGSSTLTINNSTNCTFGGILRDNAGGSGVISLVKTGTGTQTLIANSGGDITYSGSTTITQGTLVLQDITNGSLLARNITDNGTLGLSCTRGDISTPNFSGIISGSGGITISGGTAVMLSGASSNTYTGATTISDGVVILAKTSGNAITGDFTLVDDPAFVIVQNPNQFPTTAKVTFSGSGNPHLEVHGNAVTVGAIIGSGGGEIENTEGETGVTNGTIIVNNSTDCSYSGTIRDTAWGSGTLALTKTGAGTLAISGYNTFTGVTTISGGTLAVNSIANGGAGCALGAASSPGKSGSQRRNAVLQRSCRFDGPWNDAYRQFRDPGR